MHTEDEALSSVAAYQFNDMPTNTHMYVCVCMCLDCIYMACARISHCLRPELMMPKQLTDKEHRAYVLQTVAQSAKAA